MLGVVLADGREVANVKRERFDEDRRVGRLGIAREDLQVCGAHAARRRAGV